MTTEQTFLALINTTGNLVIRAHTLRKGDHFIMCGFRYHVIRKSAAGIMYHGEHFHEHQYIGTRSLQWVELVIN
jgi:hypothetical protein